MVKFEELKTFDYKGYDVNVHKTTFKNKSKPKYTFIVRDHANRRIGSFSYRAQDARKARKKFKEDIPH